MSAPYLLPAPPSLISALSYLTMTAHLLLMNLTLGGAVLISVYLLKAKEKHLVIAEAMAHRLPYLMAFTITFGIAPLLFAQALYSPMFYTSAVYLSGYFLLVPVFVFSAYVLLYVLSRKWDALGRWKALLALGSAALLSGVMLVYNHLYSLMENLGEKGAAGFSPEGGYRTGTEQLTVFPRFFHFFLASVAIAGLWVAVWGILKLNREPEQGRWQYRSGATWFSSATILSIGTGVWWLAVLPGDSAMTVMGKNTLATALFCVLALSALAALTFALLGMNSIKPSFFLRIAAALTIFNVAGMVVMRDIIRKSVLSGYFDPSAQKSHFQWAAFLIFALCLSVSFFFCWDLFKRVKTSGTSD